MQGYNALWQPGTDHAAIATEVKVTNKLKEEGIDKNESEVRNSWKDMAVERRVRRNDHQQLKKLGASCDWERERFTMDEGCSKAVQEVFIKLYKKDIFTKVPESSTGVRYARLLFLMQRLNMRIRTDFLAHQLSDRW